MTTIYHLNKNVGETNKDAFITQRKPIHVMRKTGGTFGISKKVLEHLYRKGIEYIIFLYHGKQGGKTYITTLKKYLYQPDAIFEDNPVKGGMTDRQHHVKIRGGMTEYNGHNWTSYIKTYKKAWG